ncbi:MAG: hypothetical protein ACR5KV_01380 [Wolbachia sp.]
MSILTLANKPWVEREFGEFENLYFLDKVKNFILKLDVISYNNIAFHQRTHIALFET